MKLFRAAAVSTLSLALLGGTALIAQEYHDEQQQQNDKYIRHDDWKKGQHIKQEDWNRGRRLDDWKTHHLRQPPAGYEWRDIDGHYVLANNDGVIFQVVVHH